MRRGKLSALVVLTTLLVPACGGGTPAATDDGGRTVDGGADAGLHRPPVAVPGTDRSSDVFRELQFDGTASYAPDGDPIAAYAWILIEHPPESAAPIHDSDRPRAFFTPDVRGAYRIGLVVYTTVASPRAEFRLTVSDECCRPIARTAANIDVGLLEEVALDGRPSSDPRSMALTYRWQLEASPPASSPTLSDVTAPVAHFRPDPSAPHAHYTVGLAVADSQLSSEPVTVEVSVRNSLPVVTLGGNREILPGAQVSLEAVASDADHDDLTYAWRVLTQPAHGATVTQRSGAPNEALFVAEGGIVGDYVIECAVDDRHGGLARASLTLAARNSPPTVTAGDDHMVGTRCDASGTCTAVVDLAGSATDPEGDALTVVWDRAPQGAAPDPTSSGLGIVQFTSTSTLSTRATIVATDGRAAGTYRLRLRAKDPLHDFQASTLVVTVTNRAPSGDIEVVDPDGHRTTLLPTGTTRYEATFALTSLAQDPDFGDSDPNGAHLNYNWSGPSPGESADAAATVEISNATNRTTSVTVQRDCTPGACPASPDLLGDYTVRVRVADANGASTTAVETLTVTNRAPTLALAPAAQGVAPGTIARIVANGADPDGDALAYSFELVPGTGGSLSQSGNAATLTTASTLVTHEVRVTVSDAFGASASQIARVTTNEAPHVSRIPRSVIGHACTAASGAASCTAQVELRGAATDNDPLTFEWSAVTPPVDRPNVVATLSTPSGSPTRTLSLTSGSDGALSGVYTLRFCARDPFNEPVCVPVEVVVTNEPPTDVSAGPNQSIAHHAEPAGSRTLVATFTLTGSARDPNFGATPPAEQRLAYQWTNPAPTELSFDPTQRAPTVTLSKTCDSGCGALGPYPFTLTVTDPNGASAVATTTVTVLNARPTATLTPSYAEIRDTDSVTFTVVGQDADADGLAYAWDLTALPATFSTTAVGAVATLEPAAGGFGVYAIAVRASDGFVTSDVASAVLRVNAPPTASAPAAQLSMGHQCTTAGVCSATSPPLSALATDPDPADLPLLTYAWRADPIPDATGPLRITFDDPSARNASVHIDRTDGRIAGVYNLLFCAYDPLYARPATGDAPRPQQCARTSIEVTNQPPLVTAVATPTTTVAHTAAAPQRATRYESAPATLRVTARDPETSLDNQNLTFEWMVTNRADPEALVFVGGQLAAPSIVLAGATGASPSVVVRKDCTAGCAAGPGLLGDYTLTVVARDPSGAASAPSAPLRITVANSAPSTALVSPLQFRYPAGVGAFAAIVGGRVRAGSEVRFATLSTDPDGDAVELSWGISAQPTTGAALDATHPLSPVLTTLAGQNGPGASYALAVTRTDAFGLTTIDSGTIAIDRPPNPVAIASTTTLNHTCPSTGQCQSDTFTLSVDPSDPDDTTGHTYQWRVTKPANRAGVQAEPTNSTASSSTFAIRSPADGGPIDGTYLYSVTVTDPYGESASASVSVLVRNGPPTLVSTSIASGALAHTAASKDTPNTLYTSATVQPSVVARDPESQSANTNLSYVWTVVRKADSAADVLINGQLVALDGSLTVTDATGPAPSLGVRKDCTAGCPSGVGLLGEYAVTVQAVDLSGAASAVSAPLVFTVGNNLPALAAVLPLEARFPPGTGAFAPIRGDRVRAGAEVRFGTSASDPDSDFVRTTWSLSSAPAPGATLSATDTLTPVLTTLPNQNGAGARYTLTATRTDVFGATSSDTGSITIDRPPNPTATTSASPIHHSCPSTSQCQSDTFTLTAFAGDPDDATGHTYQWTVTKPANRTSVQAEPANPTAATTTFAIRSPVSGGPIDGTYVYSVTVTDTYGESASTSVSVVVTNMPPTITSATLSTTTVFHTAASNQTLNTTYTSDAITPVVVARDPESNADNANLSFVWTVVSKADPAAVVLLNGQPVTTSVTLSSPSGASPTLQVRKDCSAGCAGGLGFLGDYAVTVQAFDLSGLPTALSAPLRFTLGNRAPTVTPNQTAARVRQRAAQSTPLSVVAASDADGDPLTYRWSLVSAPAGVSLSTTSGLSTTLNTANALAPGAAFTVQVVANDGFADGPAATITVTVNTPPRVDLLTPRNDDRGTGCAVASDRCIKHYCTPTGACSNSSSQVPSAANFGLTATVSDADRDTVRYAWSVVQAPENVALAFWPDSSSASPTISVSSTAGAIAGIYGVLLTVTDALGDSTQGSYFFEVANAPPTAQPSAAAASVSHTTSITTAGPIYSATTSLIGSGTDPECPTCTASSNDLLYTWTVASKADSNAVIQFDGVVATTSTTRSPQITITRDCTSNCGPKPYAAGTVLLSNASEGAYTFNLVVTDPNGASSAPTPVTVKVTNEAPPVPEPGVPRTVAHRYVGNSNGTDLFAATIIAGGAAFPDPNLDALDVQWYLGPPVANGVCLVASETLSSPCVSTLSAPASASLNLRGPKTLVNPGPAATHQVCLQATDPWGLSQSQCGSLTVTDAPPTGTLDPGFGSAEPMIMSVDHAYNGAAYTISVTATPTALSDPEGDPITYGWFVDVGSSGVTGAYPAAGVNTLSSGTVTLSAPIGADLVGPSSHRVCLQASTPFGSLPPVCRRLQALNRAPTFTVNPAASPNSLPFTCDRTTCQITDSAAKSVALTLTAVDPDGDPLTIDWNPLTANCGLSNPAPAPCLGSNCVSSRMATASCQGSGTGIDSWTVSVSDGLGGTINGQATITEICNAVGCH